MKSRKCSNCGKEALFHKTILIASIDYEKLKISPSPRAHKWHNKDVYKELNSNQDWCILNNEKEANENLLDLFCCDSKECMFLIDMKY